MYYRVVMLEFAKTNLRNIIAYISENLDNPIAANNVRAAIMQRIGALKFNPHLYRVVDCEPYKSRGIRSFPVKNYIVYYETDDNAKTVFVLKIAGGRQSPENRLHGI